MHDPCSILRTTESLPGPNLRHRFRIRRAQFRAASLTVLLAISVSAVHMEGEGQPPSQKREVSGEENWKVENAELFANSQDEGTRLFAFRADDVDMKRVLAMFARANQLNIIPDLDIVGSLTVDFRNLPLELAMEAILDAHGYYFEREDNLIRVRNMETRLFEIDYMRIRRSGQGSNLVQISSGVGSGGGGGGGEEQGSTMLVSADSTIDFWSDMQQQLENLISADGSFSINSLAGALSVTDHHRNVTKIETFLERISENVVRQIDLEVEIYELDYSSQNSLGIDWSRVASSLDTVFSGSVIVSEVAFGTTPGPNTITISHDRGGTAAVLEALKQEGELKVVSKPRLRTLNNQPAVIRVGQDLPIFFQTVTSAPGTPPVITSTEEIQIVTIGTVLSITPQVSRSGLITLDVSPAVSRLVRTEVSAVTGSTAPVIDVRQASSIVRLRDGETIVMGGLVQDRSSETVRKIPLLGDIPYLGRLFTGSFETSNKSELVLFLTPHIID